MTPKDSSYIDHTGSIIIPFNTDPKYHYWNGGRFLLETLTELNVTKDIWDKYTVKPYPVNVV